MHDHNNKCDRSNYANSPLPLAHYELIVQHQDHVQDKAHHQLRAPAL